MEQKQGQGKKSTKKRSAGRKSAKIEMYYSRNYPRNKLRKIIKHNGLEAAEKWADEHKAWSALKSLQKSLLNKA